MSILHLDIPTLSGDTSSLSEMAPENLQGWLDSLPLTDVTDSGRQVVTVLQKYNSVAMDTDVRFESMVRFAPVVGQLLEATRDKLRGSAFPLSSKNLERAMMAMKFVQHMADGFKICVTELDAGKGNPENAQIKLLKSVHASVKYLAEQLLSCYLIYYPEPANVWRQINNLYYYAEKKGIKDKVLGAEEDAQRTANTIEHLYKRLVLLATSNPYHLMEGEAAAILEHLNNWATRCTISEIAKNSVVKGHFYVDLAGEMPPRFASGHMEHAPVEGRSIDVDILVDNLSKLILRISEQSSNKPMSLKDRMNRDMLLRIQHAWGGRTDRQEQRQSNAETVELASGMGATHYFISGGKDFLPEKVEIDIQEEKGTSSGLSLMPLDDDQWKRDEIKEKIDAGVTQHRVSSFGDNKEDMWGKIHATKAHHQSVIEEEAARHSTNTWKKFNESSGGIGLSNANPATSRIRVGDLAVYRNSNETGWSVGTIRWLNNRNNVSMDVGIKGISANASDAGVRGIAGIGEGGEYFRSILCRKNVHGNEVNTIIVPASIYDTGSMLVLNSNNSISYIRLEKLLDTTTSYSQFEYSETEKPADNPYLKKFLQTN